MKKLNSKDNLSKYEDILFIENELKIRLPKSYKDLLLNKTDCIVFGLPILGLPLTEDITSCYGATVLLRMIKPEYLNYLVIRICDCRFLCLDLNNATENDAPLVEISTDTSQNLNPIHNSFAKYINESEISKREIKEGLKRIKNLFANKHVKSYSRFGETNIPYKAKDWRIHRCCVHDYIVGLIAFRYSELFNCIEVDVFLSTNHPEYEDEHGTKALLALLLSDAYRNGSGMEIRFTRFDSNLQKRVSSTIPQNLLNIITSSGIILSNSDKGMISHEESINIFTSILRIQEDVINKIKQFAKLNEISLQGVCFLINCRIWTIEQINWIILNATRVREVIFGKDDPEDRINYSESVSLGRCALALTKFKDKIESVSDNDSINIQVNINKLFFVLLNYHFYSIDWGYNNELFNIQPKTSLTILSRPRSNWINFYVQVMDDINTIKNEPGQKIILYCNNILNIPNFHSTFMSLNPSEELSYLILPFSTEELDEEIINKMKKARQYRI